MNRIREMFAVSTLTLVACSLFIACGGGGGGDGSSVGGGDPGEEQVWRAEAVLTADGCGERTAKVTQTFRVVRNADDTVTVDDSLFTTSGIATEEGFTFSYQAASGACVRTYEGTFTATTDTTADVVLSVASTCGTDICKNQWTGTATLQTVPAAAREDELEKGKVTGSNCIPPIPQIGYRPSLFQCFGNAAVLARDHVRNNYSIVVRRDGQFNDRDPNNPSCGTNRCSPYKTQQRIELPEYQVNCLGDTGFSANFAAVRRISVKFTALITNKNDPQQFEQYCLNSRTTDLN